jgi:hypothetical protein
MVDGIISLPVAIAGYFVLPDLPEIAKPFYLTKKVRVFVLYQALFKSNAANRKSPWRRKEWNLKVEKRECHTPQPKSRRFSAAGTYICLHSYMCKSILSNISLST